MGISHVGGAEFIPNRHVGNSAHKAGKRVMERQACVSAKADSPPDAADLQQTDK